MGSTGSLIDTFEDFLISTTSINSLVFEVVQNYSIRNFGDQIRIQHPNFSLKTSLHATSDRNVNYPTTEILNINIPWIRVFF